MKYFFYATLNIRSTRALPMLILFGLFIGGLPFRSQSQCTVICNDMVTVEVPAGGSKEILPFDILDPGTLQFCPNGVFQTQADIGGNWEPATGNYVVSSAQIGQTLTVRALETTGGNFCFGLVEVVEEVQQSDTIHFKLCTEFWKDNRPFKGSTLVFQPSNPAFPYSPFVFPLDTAHSCADLTIVLSDYLPGTTFSYAAILQDTGFLNGVDFIDLCKISKHILGAAPLPSPYALLAADANLSNSITTFDIVEIKKLILGIYPTFPNNASWRLISDYCTFPNPSNPFGNVCQPGINAQELALLDGDTAKVIIIKTGDVDGSARLPGEPPHIINAQDSLTMILPTGPVAAGHHVAVPIKFDKPFTLGSMQLWYSLPPNLVHLDSITSGVVNINAPINTYYNSATGDLRLGFAGNSNQFISAGVPLFYFHLSAVANTVLETAVKLVQTYDFTPFALGSTCDEYFEIGTAYSGTVGIPALQTPGLNVSAPSPNPFVDQTFIDMELDRAENARLEISDLTGRVIFTETKNLSAGNYRWEIPGAMIAPGSIVFWQLQVGQGKIAGKLIRQ